MGIIEIATMEDIIDPTDTIGYIEILPTEYERIIEEDDEAEETKKTTTNESPIATNTTIKYTEVMATILVNSKKFEDGDLVTIRLDEDINYNNGDGKEAGQLIKIEAWQVDEILKFKLSKGVKLTYNNKEGVPIKMFKNNEINIILKVPQ